MRNKGACCHREETTGKVVCTVQEEKGAGEFTDSRTTLHLLSVILTIQRSCKSSIANMLHALRPSHPELKCLVQLNQAFAAHLCSSAVPVIDGYHVCIHRTCFHSYCTLSGATLGLSCLYMRAAVIENLLFLNFPGKFNRSFQVSIILSI